MRIFIGMLATETNTFAPFPTPLRGFEEFLGVVRDGSIGMAKDGPMGVLRRRAEADGHEVIETISAFAQPSGRVVDAVYEQLRDELLADLRVAVPVDIVILPLHGAMVAQGYDDCEGDILQRVREIAPAAVIGVELDPHCHMTEAMVGNADVIILSREYPHIDFCERANELYDICVRTAAGEIEPVGALVDTSIVGFYPTFTHPMRGIVDELTALEHQPGILTASIIHGFPWADVAEVGARTLVYADKDADAAAQAANQIAGRLYDLRHELAPAYPSIAQSLDRAAAANGHIVLADFADNPGGGAASDSTFMLRALVERDAHDVALGAIWDPIAVQTCADAGIGARLELRLGGKAGARSGPPIDLPVEVMNVVEDFAAPGLTFPQRMGRTVWLRAGGIDIVACSIRAQIISPEAFTGLGIDLSTKRLTVVKSQAHYQAAFGPICDQSWPFTSPGTMDVDFARIPYTKRHRDFFPCEPDPWSTNGRPQPRIYRRGTARK